MFLAGLCLYCGSSEAAPSVWSQARGDTTSRAETLLVMAERSRTLTRLATPFGSNTDQTSRSLQEKLNELVVGILSSSHNRDLEDPRLDFLRGEALLGAGAAYWKRAPDSLREALHKAPNSPLAAKAWFDLAIAERKLRHRDAEHLAYTNALREEWHPELRATLFLNRAESSMSQRSLVGAIEDYRQALELSRSLKTRSLAQWGLAVALDRSGNLPAALESVRSASRPQFLRNGRPSTALDLPGLYFLPSYEIHYYRALAAMAQALSAKQPQSQRSQLQTAQFLWTQFINEARKGRSPWLTRAEQHRSACRSQTQALKKN